MKIGLHSDIHLEFAPHTLSREYLDSLDVLVLAGDIGLGLDGVEWAASLKAKCPVFYLPGNHEFYNEDFLRLSIQLLNRCRQLGITYLHNNAEVVDGVLFVGGTLWTDFSLCGDAALSKLRAPQVMNDYRLISNFNPNMAEQEHAYTRRHILTHVKGAPSGVVVVTHHAPHINSIGRRYRGGRNDYINAYYASDLTDILEEPAVKLWLHGHTHSNSDYVVGGTRVLSNCRGCVGHDPNPDYDPNFMVEL